MKSGSYRGLSRYFNQIQETGSLWTNYGSFLLLVIQYRNFPCDFDATIFSVQGYRSTATIVFALLPLPATLLLTLPFTETLDFDSAPARRASSHILFSTSFQLNADFSAFVSPTTGRPTGFKEAEAFFL